MFATKKDFDGRRARVNDPVVIGAPRLYGQEGTAVRAGVVLEISAKEDKPWILDLGRAGSASLEYSFVRTTTEAEVDALKLGEWTWPLALPWVEP